MKGVEFPPLPPMRRRSAGRTAKPRLLRRLHRGAEGRRTRRRGDEDHRDLARGGRRLNDHPPTTGRGYGDLPCPLPFNQSGMTGTTPSILHFPLRHGTGFHVSRANPDPDGQEIDLGETDSVTARFPIARWVIRINLWCGLASGFALLAMMLMGAIDVIGHQSRSRRAARAAGARRIRVHGDDDGGKRLPRHVARAGTPAPHPGGDRPQPPSAAAPPRRRGVLGTVLHRAVRAHRLVRLEGRAARYLGRRVLVGTHQLSRLAGPPGPRARSDADDRADARSTSSACSSSGFAPTLAARTRSRVDDRGRPHRHRLRRRALPVRYCSPSASRWACRWGSSGWPACCSAWARRSPSGQLRTLPFAVVNNYAFAVLPMFVLMGVLAEAAGLNLAGLSCRGPVAAPVPRRALPGR